MLSWIRNAVARSTRSPYRKPVRQRRTALSLERLEDRLVMNNSFNVTSLADSGTGSLRAAIASASSGDTIIFSGAAASGTIKLQSGQITLNKNLNIQGPGANTLTVDRDSTASAFGLFLIMNGSTVTISGLTLTGGNSSLGSGGAILNGGTLTLSSCIITGNSAGSTIEAFGGGVFNEGNLTATDCTFANNSAVDGAGIYQNGLGSATITGCTFSQNKSSGAGGGILVGNPVTVNDSTFSGNQAGGNGGGLALQGGTATVTACTFNANVADQGGQGGSGGGISGNVTLDSTLVAGNTNNGTTDDDINGTVAATSAYNLIGDGTGLKGISNGDSDHNQVGTSASPIDPKLGTFQNNGGPTETLAPASGSPAIGAGDPALTGTDQIGNARAFDGRVDVGAFEVQAKALQTATITGLPQGQALEGTSLTLGSTLVDIDPNDVLTYAWKVSPAFGGNDLATGTGSTITFTPPFGNYSVQLTVSNTFNESVGKVVVLMINDVIPTVNLGGTAVTFNGLDFSQGGSFTDPGPDTWTAAVNYGDGTGSQPLSLNADKTFSLSHQYPKSGTYTVKVTVNDGNKPGFASLAVTAVPFQQSISFQPLAPIAFIPNEPVVLKAGGGASGNPLVFSIDASSSGNGTISGNILTVTEAGNIVIDANQDGGAAYLPAAQVQQTLQVNKANAVIVVVPYGVTYDGNAHSAAGMACALDGTNLTSELSLTGTAHTSAGSYSDTWTFTGDNNYNATQGTVSDNIVPANSLAITASAGPTVVLGTNAPLTASATLANGINLSGTLTFTLLDSNGNLVDTETAAVNGNGTYTTPTGYVPKVAGTYQWMAGYGSDSNNQSITSGSVPEVATGASAAFVGTTLYLVGGNTADRVSIQHVGASNTGTTGIQVSGRLNGVSLNLVYPAPAAIYFFGSGGNDRFSMENKLTIPAVVSEGNGNDALLLGQGNNSVTVGSGNDHVQAGNGTNVLTANTGAGQAHVTLGNGNNTVTVSDSSTGSAAIQVGNGNNLITAGTGTNTIVAGNGDNLIIGGLGHDTIHAGKGRNILIDGSVSDSNAVLDQVLAEWVNGGAAAAATIRGQLQVTDNATNTNTLHAGSGLDWFWATDRKDHLNRKSTDLLN